MTTITKKTTLLACPPVVTNMHGDGDEANKVSRTKEIIFEGTNLGGFDKERFNAIQLEMTCSGEKQTESMLSTYIQSVTATKITTSWRMNPSADVGSTVKATLSFPGGKTVVAQATVLAGEM